MYMKPTKEAYELKTALEKLGIRVLAEVDDGHKHIDLTIPSSRINIEVDGGQHLTDSSQILKDLVRSHYSDDLGYDTIHIPNQAIHSNLGGIASALAEAAKIREEAFKKKPVFDMGIATSEAFRGHSIFNAVKEIYGDSAPLFASVIKSKFPVTEKEYKLLDIGSSKGELLSDVLKLLPNYHFDITVSDTNSDAIAHNTVPGKHIVADAETLPFPDADIDIAIMRYVLRFNLLESQKKIISEIARIIKGIAIIQHGGADDIDTDLWREKVDKIFRNDTLPQIKRNGMFWSSAREIEDFMRTSNIKFEKVLSKKISEMSQAYIERYSLNNEQVELIKKIMGDKDYLVQTTWLIYPNENPSATL